MDDYSAGVSFLNIMPKLEERTVGIVIAVIGTLLCFVFPIENYESFLYMIGSVFAPLFAVLLTDYFIIKKNTKLQPAVLLNFGAIVVWVIGVAIYYSFIRLDFVLGATAPAMVITSVIYILAWRWTSKWKLVKKSQDYYSA
jgi:purine-cytosine permease-like protein